MITLIRQIGWLTGCLTAYCLLKLPSTYDRIKCSVPSVGNLGQVGQVQICLGPTGKEVGLETSSLFMKSDQITVLKLSSSFLLCLFSSQTQIVRVSPWNEPLEMNALV